jgi:hypothetical protein
MMKAGCLVRLTCPSCGAAGSVPDRLKGRAIRCPKCKAQFRAEEAPVPEMTLAEGPRPPKRRPLPLAVRALAAVAAVAAGVGAGLVVAHHIRLADLAEEEARAAAPRPAPADDVFPLGAADPTFEGIPASAWARLLEDGDLDTRLRASKALLFIGDAAVPHVEPVYREGSLVGRLSASVVLVQMMDRTHSQAALAAMLRAARDDDPRMRAVTVSQLGEHAAWSAEARKAVEAAAGDPAPRVAEAAREALAKMRAAKGPG